MCSYAQGLQLIVNLGEGIVRDHGIVVQHIGDHVRVARLLDRGKQGVALQLYLTRFSLSRRQL